MAKTIVKKLMKLKKNLMMKKLRKYLISHLTKSNLTKKNTMKVKNLKKITWKKQMIWMMKLT
jgi:hypothetical protein